MAYLINGGGDIVIDKPHLNLNRAKLLFDLSILLYGIPITLIEGGICTEDWCQPSIRVLNKN